MTPKTRKWLGWLPGMEVTLEDTTPEDAPEFESEPEPEKEDWRTKMAREEREAIAAAFAELEPHRQEHVDAAVAEHEADSAAYSFSCSRRGDFLTLRMTRLGHRYPSVIDKDQSAIGPVSTEKHINLSLVTGIDFVEGSAPATETPLSCYISYQKIGGPDEDRLTIVPIELAPPGYRMTASFRAAPARMGGRVALMERTEAEADWGYHGASNRTWEKTPDFPRPAEDDEVLLRGLGVVICTPYGRGREVLAAILDEIETGYGRAA